MISLHWLLRADEAEGLSLEMTSLFLHEGMSGPGDITLRLPMSKTDPRGNGASRRLTCICKLPVEVGDMLPEACPVGAVHRQVSRLHSLFGWAIDDDRAGKPLFPRAGGLRASKVQLVQAWSMATAQNEKPSGHSPRRSGAKRYARQGWSVWMIQFMGRWAASTVLEYIEEAMAEVTACWVKRPAGCFTENHKNCGAFRLTGSTGGCPKLSERVDRIEQIILDTKARLEQSESQCHQLALKQAEFEDHVQGQQLMWKTNDKCDLDRTVHFVVEESLEWPNALWTTKCGWRCGAARFRMQRCGMSLQPGWRVCQKCTRMEVCT